MEKIRWELGIVYRDSHSLVYGWKKVDEEDEAEKEKALRRARILKASSKGMDESKAKWKWDNFYRKNKKGWTYENR